MDYFEYIVSQIQHYTYTKHIVVVFPVNVMSLKYKVEYVQNEEQDIKWEEDSGENVGSNIQVNLLT